MKKSDRTAKYRNYYEPWSKSDLKTLRRLYPHNYNNRLVRIFDRTPDAIRTRARRLGLKRKYDDEFKPYRSSKQTVWSDEEVRILKQMYPSHTFEEISDSIDRTASAIFGKAQKLKLKKRKLWTKKEDSFLRRFHGKKSRAELGRILGRTVQAIGQRAKKFGITHETVRWTKRECYMLIKRYPKMQTQGLAKLLGRSSVAISIKAGHLRIKKNIGGFAAGGRRWTKEEDKIIRKYYKKMPYKDLSAKLGRSCKSIEHRIAAIG